jgi:molybdate transport system substrate-binding protein
MPQGMKRMTTLKVLSAGAMKFVVEGLAPRSDATIDSTFGTIATVLKHMEGGASPDVLIGTIPAVEKWERDGVIAPGSRRDIGRTLTGLGVREGTPVPDISTVAKFKQAMLDAKSVGLTDPARGGSSVIYMVTLLERLGILDEVRRKARFYVDGIKMVEGVLAGEAELASTFLSEVVPRNGMRSAGPLPAEVAHGMSYGAGVAAGSANGAAAQRFVDQLGGCAPDFLAARGFEAI